MDVFAEDILPQRKPEADLELRLGVLFSLS
jgi:hypothetical protein